MIDQEDVNRWTVNPDILKRDYDELKSKHEMFTKLMADKFMDMNRGMIKLQMDRDDARVEVVQLKDKIAAYEQVAVSQKVKVRPEPSRLEIAAMLLQGLLANPSTEGSLIHHYRALDQADALIAAAKEVTK
jgi:hypothetical protein